MNSHVLLRYLRCLLLSSATSSHRATILPALLLLAITLLFTGCNRASKTQAAFDLPIYFSWDTRGRLEPCGCFTGQYGGLTRLKTVLDNEATANALRVDIGDAIGGSEDYDRIQHRYLLRAFAAMQYDALNIGRREA